MRSLALLGLLCLLYLLHSCRVVSVDAAFEPAEPIVVFSSTLSITFLVSFQLQSESLNLTLCSFTLFTLVYLAVETAPEHLLVRFPAYLAPCCYRPEN